MSSVRSFPAGDRLRRYAANGAVGSPGAVTISQSPEAVPVKRTAVAVDRIVSQSGTGLVSLTPNRPNTVSRPVLSSRHEEYTPRPAEPAIGKTAPRPPFVSPQSPAPA